MRLVDLAIDRDGKLSCLNVHAFRVDLDASLTKQDVEALSSKVANPLSRRFSNLALDIADRLRGDKLTEQDQSTCRPLSPVDNRIYDCVALGLDNSLHMEVSLKQAEELRNDNQFDRLWVMQDRLITQLNEELDNKIRLDMYDE